MKGFEMDSWTRTYLGSLTIVLTLIGVVPAQDDSQLAEFDSQRNLEAIEDIFVEVEVGDAAEGFAQLTAPNEVVRNVRLMFDGSLQGRARIIYPTGKTIAADAQIEFKQSGEVLQAAQTGDEGLFELTGLEPGRYTATVSIEAGSTDFPVNVLPYDSGANDDQMILDATLTPTPEIVSDEAVAEDTCPTCDKPLDENGVCPHCAEELIVEEIIEPLPAACCGGFEGGGCCGGGGGVGMWPLLGLAGLAGLAGLDDDDPTTVIVSPFAP